MHEGRSMDARAVQLLNASKLTVVHTGRSMEVRAVQP
jgi:hypothetical protein